jgi:hypothetical protein
MDGRSGSSSMRLNFAGIPEPEIREGIRRIGRAISQQLALLGSLTGTGAPAPAGSGGAEEREDGDESDPSGLADVVALPRRQDSERGRRRQDR